MAQLGPIPNAAVRDDAPDADDFGLVVRVVGGVVVVGPVVVDQGTNPWIVSDPPLEAAIDVALSTRASEATLAALNAMLTAQLDVALSTRAAASQLPAALVGGRLDTNVGAWLGSAAPTVGQKTMANSIPVTIASDQTEPAGTLANGAQTPVGAAAVQIAAANANRKSIIIQNVGAANIRVGVMGVTNVTGTQLLPGGTLILEMPYCPTQALFAIREGAIDSIAFAQEIT